MSAQVEYPSPPAEPYRRPLPCPGPAAHAADGEAIDLHDFGLVAVFRQPSQAIACAFDLRSRLNQIGLNVQAAIHIGECGRHHGHAGPVLQLAAGLAGCARPGDIIASRTVRDLAIGTNLSFDPRGELDLPGIPGPWRYFSVGPVLAMPRTGASNELPEDN